MSLIHRHSGHSCICNEHKESVEKERSGRGLMCKDVSASKDQGISEILAAKLALDALEKYEAKPIPKPACNEHHEDLRLFPFRVFDLLDRTLFRGVLSGEVYLLWSPLREDIHGVTSKPGARNGRIMIQLNSGLLMIPPIMLLAVLIHHMAHAYFLVCCGFKEDPEDRHKYDLLHGVCFSTLIHKITEVVRPSENDKTKKLPDLTQWATNHEQSPPHLEEGPRNQQKQWGVSSCSLAVNDFLSNTACRGQVEILRNMKVSELMVEKKLNPFPTSHYFHTVDLEKSKFTPVLRKRQKFNPSKELELLYAYYAIPFPKDKLKAFPSLNALSENVSQLKVPAKSDKVFFAFYNFLQRADYPPEMAPISTPYQDAVRAGGPPIIAEFQPKGPAHLLTDIGVFIAASGMTFLELKTRALKRMYSMNTMHEDPMKVLEEVYGDACSKLREEDKQKLHNWAIEFLGKGRPESGITNRKILRSSEQWSSRLKTLWEKSSDFRRDCGQHKEESALDKMIQLIKHGGGDIRDPYLADIERNLNKASLDSQSLLPLDELDIGMNPRRTIPSRSHPRESNISGHDYLVSPQELNMIHHVYPKLAPLYENFLAGQRELEAAAARSKKKQKPKASDRTRNKGKSKARDDFPDDNDLFASSSDESDRCFHSCYSCDIHGLVCRHYTEKCVYCGLRRFPRGRRGSSHEHPFASLGFVPLDGYAGPSSSMNLMPGF